jgi:hypothetical protein
VKPTSNLGSKPGEYEMISKRQGSPEETSMHKAQAGHTKLYMELGDLGIPQEVYLNQKF